ncbi:MAG: hypothetical protein ACJ73N_11860 [Bryobacteraceae bacterium]
MQQEPETYGPLRASERVAGAKLMSEIPTTAVAVRTESARPWTDSVLQAITGFLSYTGNWAGDFAQRFAALLSDLMGPAVFSAYALAAWSLTSSFGWTESFIFSAGPLSNWLVWLAFAILLNFAASILKRHTQS